jgi:hypothetical protein
VRITLVVNPEFSVCTWIMGVDSVVLSFIMKKKIKNDRKESDLRMQEKEIFKNRFQDQNAENIDEQIARFRVQKNR